jgi:membrane-associated HD superfamily phosphohydrolase
MIRLECNRVLTRCKYAIALVWLIVFMWLILILLILTANVRNSIAVKLIIQRKSFCFRCKVFLVVVEWIWIFSASLNNWVIFQIFFFSLCNLFIIFLMINFCSFALFFTSIMIIVKSFVARVFLSLILNSALTRDVFDLSSTRATFE